MINTVTGSINSIQLGVTLMHEHIVFDSRGADYESKETEDYNKIISTLVPILLELKKVGCQTLVDSTPPGEGRHVNLLQECAKQTGLQIITNTGSFYKTGVSQKIRNASIDEIVTIWNDELINGIEGTTIKPGFIKIALDDGEISPLQEKILRAACRFSQLSNLTIQCHIKLSQTVLEAVPILKEEELPLERFIWAHADKEGNIEVMTELGKQGMWIEVDLIGSRDYFDHIQMLETLIQHGIQERILISQDTEGYELGINNPQPKPFHNIFTEFLPLCKQHGITNEIIKQLVVINPTVCLDV